MFPKFPEGGGEGFASILADGLIDEFRTVLFVAVVSGSAASCTAVTFRLFILGEQVCDKRFKVECHN